LGQEKKFVEGSKMFIDIEILESDLQDRNILIEMRAEVEEKITKLSDYARNNLGQQLNWIRGDIERTESKWLEWQKERAINKLAEALNVGREKFGDREWRDD